MDGSRFRALEKRVGFGRDCGRVPGFVMKRFVLAAAVFGLVGCKSQCRVLSEKLCDCAINSLDKDACIRRAATNEGQVVITAADEATCAALVNQCDCRIVDTTVGKERCGLARTSP